MSVFIDNFYFSRERQSNRFRVFLWARNGEKEIPYIEYLKTFCHGSSVCVCVCVCVCVGVCVSCSVVWLCDPMDCSQLASSVHGILLTKILKWVAIPFSRGSSQPGDWTQSPTLLAGSLLSEPPGKSWVLERNTFHASFPVRSHITDDTCVHTQSE